MSTPSSTSNTDSNKASKIEMSAQQPSTVSADFDLHHIPFSRYGSYLAVSWLPAEGERAAGLYLRSVRGPAIGGQELYQIELVDDGESVPFDYYAQPTLLTLKSAVGQVDICMPTAGTVRFRAQGIALRLTMQVFGYNNVIPIADGRWLTTVSGHFETKLLLGTLRGTIYADAPWRTIKSEHIRMELRPEDGGDWLLEEYRIDPAGNTVDGISGHSFDGALQTVATEFEEWCARQPKVLPQHADAARLAAYINWSCVVAPSGLLSRPAMYMSKNQMANIWSWDNCFNALALAAGHPGLAWDQLKVMFDLQDAEGALPDLANDLFASWGFCKPPVHGWALEHIFASAAPFLDDFCDEIYEPLARWTKWWFRHRSAENGLPHYYHGNESGWDNSTVFDVQPPIQSPDLCAYLVLQMESLADLARRLGRDEEAESWQRRSSAMLTSLIETFWDGDQFVARRSLGGQVIRTDSLLLHMPLLLGTRLPKYVRDGIVAKLKEPGQFLTPHGLASEAQSSEHYSPDGYWRGPIWGAPMLMLTEGLDAVGEQAFANDLRRAFCDMVATNGLAENYNALGGQGLRDRAFTWTSSIFLLLAHQLYLAETGNP